ncbi:MAG: Sensor histidine kinase RcsC [Chroococcidiopsis cubana SAG 39.79]|uniref:sensor histidine kinase n=1 Tax=Chroococcidiopsis cubana TaxID=171392 RepID=UPI000D0639BB|nr:ATP-binding protein [Chroococcidiopsis cubana]MDZ4875710.1 Sensor histidine kinase RcsC [Chroococcidiopsis cubana SAG 39.79]PSB57411.1 histidine kinase [Chroococcidiopsis cubana CCALA 043]
MRHKKHPNRAGLNRNSLLNRITNRIHQSLELQQILSVAVQEIRAFLQIDRVKVYKFHPDGTGQVIAEAIAAKRLPSLLGLHFPADDIPAHAREMFVKIGARSIVDVPQQQISLSYLKSPQTTGDLTLEEVQQRTVTEILQRPVDPCHVEYLTAMGVQSSLVIPILHDCQLWGLLACHHAQPKTFRQEQLDVVRLVVEHLAIAISQSQLLTQARERAIRQELINKISTLLHSPHSIQTILQIALESIVNSVDGSGGRLYLCPTGQAQIAEIYTDKAQPQGMLENAPFWQQLMAGVGRNPQHGYVAIANLYQAPELLEVAPAFQTTNIRSLFVMPLHYGSETLGCLTIFRDAIDTDITWAGRFDPDERISRVRHSFEAWRELKRGQSKEWTSSEIELVQALANHLSLAVMQHRLHEYERQQRQLLERRNQELKTARTLAEEANRLKSDFLSSTSHELRTPLAATLNYLKLLKEGLYYNEVELKEYIQIAYQSAENLVTLINDILDLAKIEAGRLVMHWEEFELMPLLTELQRLFQIESNCKAIPLSIDCQVERIYADKFRLRQVLTNLLANAFKFTETGQVCIRAITKTDEPAIEISVTDTGIGIEPSQAAVLFEPFVQADGSVKRRYGGTGLGLTVCQRLVELMGGKICLESPGLGQGTKVTFTLPVRQGSRE